VREKFKLRGPSEYTTNDGGIPALRPHERILVDEDVVFPEGLGGSTFDRFSKARMLGNIRSGTSLGHKLQIAATKAGISNAITISATSSVWCK